MTEPEQILGRAFASRISPVVEQLRAEGWPVMMTMVRTEDRRTLVLLSVELSMQMTPETARLASPLPIVASPPTSEESRPYVNFDYIEAAIDREERLNP